MNTPQHALYTYACGRPDLTHWLMNEDIARLYQESLQYTKHQQTRLLETLLPEDAAVFQKFLDNATDARQLESEMFFYQGLAMGLQLGAMVSSA